MIRAALAAFLLSGSAVTAAEEYCDPYERILNIIQDRYDEVRIAAGLDNSDVQLTILEVFVNSETGSFTILRRHADGKACVISVGFQWETAPTRKPPNL